MSEATSPDPCGRASASAPDAGGAALELPKGVHARAGTEPFWTALKTVLDPEFPVSVVDLGLIYDIRRDAGRIEVDLTFTATACPCMDFIKDDVRDRLAREAGVDAVAVNVVWDPPWTRERMTAAAREILRRYGVAA